MMAPFPLFVLFVGGVTFAVFVELSWEVELLEVNLVAVLMFADSSEVRLVEELCLIITEAESVDDELPLAPV